jgi:hypothetical protein
MPASALSPIFHQLRQILVRREKGRKEKEKAGLPPSRADSVSSPHIYTSKRIQVDIFLT